MHGSCIPICQRVFERVLIFPKGRDMQRRFFSFFVFLVAIFCSVTIEAGAADIERLESEREQIREAIGVAEELSGSLQEILNTKTNTLVMLRGRRDAEKAGLNKLKSNLTSLDQQIARLTSIGDLAEAWNAYKESGRTKEAFKKLYRTVNGKAPDNSTLDQYDIHERIIHKQIIDKAICPIGQALVLIGKLLIDFVGNVQGGFPETIGGRDSWDAAESVVEMGDKAFKIADDLREKLPMLRKVADFIEDNPILVSTLSTIEKQYDAVIGMDTVLPTAVTEYIEAAKEKASGILVYVPSVGLSISQARAEAMAEDLQKQAYLATWGTDDREKKYKELTEHKEKMLADYERAVARYEPFANGVATLEAEMENDSAAGRDMIVSLKSLKTQLSAKDDEIKRARAEEESQKATQANNKNKKSGQIYSSSISFEAPSALSADFVTELVTGIPARATFVSHIGKQNYYEQSVKYVVKQDDSGKPVYGNEILHFLDNLSAVSDNSEVKIVGGDSVLAQNGDQLLGRSAGLVKVHAETHGIAEVSQESTKAGNDTRIKLGTVRSQDHEISVSKVKELRVSSASGKSDIIDLFRANSFDLGVNSSSERVVVTAVVSSGKAERQQEISCFNAVLSDPSNITMHRKNSSLELQNSCVSGKSTLRLGIPDENGEMQVVKKISLTSNLISFERIMPAEFLKEKENYAPVGEEVIYRLKIDGPVDLTSSYDVVWETEGSQGTKITQQAPESSNGFWHADLRVSFTEERLADSLIDGSFVKGPDFTGRVRLVRKHDRAVICQITLPAIKPTIALTDLEIAEVWGNSAFPVSRIDLFSPATKSHWDRFIGVAGKVAGGRKCLIPLTKVFWELTPGSLQLDQAKGNFYANNNVLRENMRTGDAGKKKLSISMNSLQAMKMGVMLGNDESLTDDLLITLNKLDVIQTTNEKGDKVYRVVVYGPAELSGYKSEWLFSGSQNLTTTFSRSSDLWASEAPANRVLIKIRLIDGLGREVAVYEALGNQGAPLETPDISITVPEFVKPGKKALIKVDISNLRSTQSEDYLTSYQTDVAGAKFERAEHRTPMTSATTAESNGVLVAPSSVSASGMELPFVVKLLRVIGSGSEEIRVPIVEKKSFIHVGSKAKDASVETTAADVTGEKKYIAGNYDWNISVEQVNPLQGNNPLDSRNPVATIATELGGYNGGTDSGNSPGTGTFTGTGTGTGTNTNTGTGTDTGTETETAAVSGEIGFRTGPPHIYQLYAGINVDPNTGKGTLRNDGEGPTLIFQAPPDNKLTDDITAFPDALVKTWSWDGKPANTTPSGRNAVLFQPGQIITFNMISVTDTRTTITARVDKMSDKAVKDRRDGDLKLVIISSKSTLPSKRRNAR